jgi:excisionase family DNA binding protein
MSEKLLTALEVAGIFLVTEWTVREWCKQGKFPNATKPGRAWRIPEADVKALLEVQHG